MNSALNRFCLAFASFAFLFAGCTKKPVRPDPSSTVLGPQGGGGGASSLTPEPVASNPDLGGLQSRDAGFDASGQLRGAVEPVYFDFDKYAIKGAERSKVQAAKDYLEKNPQYRFILEGHCDWRGTAEYNLALGDRRCNSVKRYLATLGVSAERIDTVSKGSEEAVKGADEGTRAKERRVEFVVVKGAGGAGPAESAGPPAPAGPTGANAP
jgi:peptidoglycan-associated lipoprotein